jgi:hypothetical protein
MRYDSAVNLQAEIFEKAFQYEQAPIAFSADLDETVGPTFMEPVEDLPQVDDLLRGDMAGLSGHLPRRTVVSRSLQDRFEQLRRIALGIGAKGGGEGEHEIVVLCQDRGLLRAGIVERINRLANGECRIRYIGRPRAYSADFWHRGHVLDPLRIGSSIGHAKVTAGTLGCFVRHRTSGELGVLSNNHVLANVNSASKGDPIRQPARKDGGRSANRIAALDAYVPMRPHGVPNLHDCAWAALDPNGRQCNPPDLFDSAGARIGAISSAVPATVWPEAEVMKVGRTTGFTRRVVDAINVNNLTVSYLRNQTIRFDGQLQIQSQSKSPFARGGDSGALILNAAFEPVGLLFSGSSVGGHANVGYTWAHPIDSLLDALNP